MRFQRQGCVLGNDYEELSIREVKPLDIPSSYLVAPLSKTEPLVAPSAKREPRHVTVVALFT